MSIAKCKMREKFVQFLKVYAAKSPATPLGLIGNKILQRPKEKLAVYKYLDCNLLILLSGSARLSDYKSI